MNETVVTRTSLTTNRLRELLLGGKFPPGSRLPEAELAKLLGVSRTPIRDALNSLSKEGLVSYLPNRGYEVRSCTLEDVLGAYRVRRTLESLACRIAAENGLSVHGRAQIMDATERTEALLNEGSWRNDSARCWRMLNAQFHDTIIEATQNKILRQAINDTLHLPILVSGGGTRWFTHSELVLLFDDQSVRNSHAEHGAIFEAILKRDGDKAAAIMDAHITRAGKVLEQNWNNGLGLK
ncbi:GntR family transcriptional regulator [Rhodoligotrophos ferricapiens]|uniref:GntR family transcriptional regulator n=1 Tax=Rhodoligotrophos ferricapiens TaxID=3069264 RepID=UPI00315CF763